MHQVPEKYSFAATLFSQVIEFNIKMLQCGAIILCAAAAIGCGSQTDKSNESGSGAGSGAVTALRTLYRGLPGEPRTLDPQMAEDTYSFQVIRDLFEGLTAEDRQGQIVPGVASSWT